MMMNIVDQRNAQVPTDLPEIFDGVDRVVIFKSQASSNPFRQPSEVLSQALQGRVSIPKGSAPVHVDDVRTCQFSNEPLIGPSSWISPSMRQNNIVGSHATQMMFTFRACS